MKTASLVVVLLMASGVSAEVILENPDGDLSPSVFFYQWLAQKFDVEETTQLTELEAYVRRDFGIGDLDVAIYSDDDGEPGDQGGRFSLPVERIFESRLPVPLGQTDFAWTSTGMIDGPTLEPGSYWLAFVTEPSVDFVFELGAFTDPERQHPEPC